MRLGRFTKRWSPGMFGAQLGSETGIFHENKRDQKHNLDPQKVAFGKGNPLISAKSRLVKYDNLVRYHQYTLIIPCPPNTESLRKLKVELRCLGYWRTQWLMFMFIDLPFNLFDVYITVYFSKSLNLNIYIYISISISISILYEFMLYLHILWFHVISGSLIINQPCWKNTYYYWHLQAVPRTGYFHRDECKCAEAQKGIDGISLGGWCEGFSEWKHPSFFLVGRWVE